MTPEQDAKNHEAAVKKLEEAKAKAEAYPTDENFIASIQALIEYGERKF
jgi:hypothetical protein